jgi:hypothetical protein
MDDNKNISNSNLIEHKYAPVLKIVLPILIIIMLVAAFFLGGVYKNKGVVSETEKASLVAVDGVRSSVPETLKTSERIRTNEVGLMTYTNVEMGIEFDYPAEWGILKGEFEDECRFHYDSSRVNTYTVPPSCSSLSVGSVDKKVAWIDWWRTSPFLYSNPQPRDGDGSPIHTFGFKNQGDIDNYCTGARGGSLPTFKNDPRTISCDVYTNKNGIKVARHSRSSVPNVDGDLGPGIFYYIYTGNLYFPAISFNVKPIYQEQMNKVVDSLQLLPKN